jgi:hypothetical protein
MAFRQRLLVACLGIASIVVGLAAVRWAQPSAGRLFFHFIDVGQAHQRGEDGIQLRKE